MVLYKVLKIIKFIIYYFIIIIIRGVDPYGTGGTHPPQYSDWGGKYFECPPQYFNSNIGYFSSM